MKNVGRLAQLSAIWLGLHTILLLSPLVLAQSEEEPKGIEATSGEETGRPGGESDGNSSSRHEPKQRLGGPDQVDRRLEEDAATVSRVFEKRLIAPYLEWKTRLAEKHGLAFGIDYSLAYLDASASPEGANDQAGGGMGRFYGSWDLVGRDSGSAGAFVWKVEHRHRYTDIPPSAFGFNLGYAGLIEPPFSNQGLRWTNLYWRQRWNNGRVAALGGFLDATDYVDVYALASPWTGFLNFAFSTGTLTIPVPNDAAFGAAAGGMLSKNIFVIGGLVDRNSDPTSPFDGLGTFFNDNEYFKSVEIGWTPSPDRLYLDNAHLTFWHADERKEAGEAGGWGFNASFTRHLGGEWLPFVRGGYASKGGSLMQKSVSAGFGYQPVPKGDLLGVGLNWGQPNEDTFGPRLRNQYTIEVFYRWQLTPRLAITPDLQLLLDPAIDFEQGQIWLLGVRIRMAL